jgi:leucyl/phenylalanyl-tRNA--protein transferase
MPVYRLPEEHIFPPPDHAEDDGLLAVGGDLSEDRLLLAYTAGIFPWYSEGSPVLWWSPDPRLVLIPDELKVSRSLRQKLKKDVFTITMDTAFESVITHCATVQRRENNGTWITDDMISAYTKLHNSGYAHSIEAWHGRELAGGLYGISLGTAFFGESMFAIRSDASKVSFVRLVQQLQSWQFTLVDCQITTAHLVRFGAKEITRSDFQHRLRQALERPTKKGKWRFDSWPEKR